MKRHTVRLASLAAIAILLIAASAPIAAAASATGLADAPEAQSLLVLSGLQRIRFASDATSAVVSGDLAANSTARYILRAGAGQLMDVGLSAPDGVSLYVTTADGRALARLTGSSTAFRGILPRTGDYILRVTSGAAPASYSLNVMIPQRVSFRTGTTSATLTAHVDAHQSLDYILRARAGQLLDISVTPDNSVQLILYGVDGSVLRSGMGEGASFRGPLPLSEDYIATVRAGDQGITFTMTATIPQRINFQPGAFSGSVRGSLRSSQTQYYVLRAAQDQTMTVKVTPDNAVQLIIYGADGAVLKSGMGGGASFTGKLPSTQDYILALRAGPTPAAYTLQVTIR